MKTRPAPRTQTFFLRLLRSTTLLLALAAPVTMTAACASKPTMEVHNARITNVSPFGIGMDVVVKVYNDNSFDIMIRQVTAKTTVAGRYQLPQVTVQPNVWLPAKKTTYITTPMTIPWTLVPGGSIGNDGRRKTWPTMWRAGPTCPPLVPLVSRSTTSRSMRTASSHAKSFSVQPGHRCLARGEDIAQILPNDLRPTD